MSNLKVVQERYQQASNPRALEKRKALRRAMLMLLDKRAFDDITVADIAKAAGAGYTTFYRHYPGKDELLEEIATEEINTLIELVLPVFGTGEDEASRVATSQRFCSYIDEHRALWRTLLTGGAASRLREQFIQLAREIARQVPHVEGRFLPPEAGCVFGVGSTIELLVWWLEQDKPLSPDEFSEVYQHLVITPLCI